MSPSHLLTPRCLAASVVSVAVLTAQQPTFRTSVELVRLDVTVVDAEGHPVADLTPEDFDVSVDGKPAEVRTLRLLDLTAPTLASPSVIGPAYSSNLESPNGRLWVVAVDQDNLPHDGARPALETVASMIDRLGAADRMSIAGLPDPGPRIDFTNDTAALRETLFAIQPRAKVPASTGAGLTTFDDPRASPTAGRGRDIDGRGMGMDHPYRRPANLSGLERGLSLMGSLTKLAESLVPVEGPKTLLVFSAGLPYDQDLLHRYKGFARAAAEARLTVHVVRLHVIAGAAGNATEQVTEPAEDFDGASMLAGLTGGTVANGVARATGVIGRIDRESTATYVLGVEPPGGRAISKPLDVSVKVKREHLTVRTPRQVVPPVRRTYRSVRAELNALLQQPRAATEFPMRVMTATTGGALTEKLDTVISVELGLDATESRDLKWAWQVVEGSRVVADERRDTLPTGTWSADDTAFAFTTALAAGSYHLRVAAVDRAGRRASVSHAFEASLPRIGTTLSSDLVVGIDHAGRVLPRSAVSPATGLTTAIDFYGGRDDRSPTEVEFALAAADGASRAVTRAPVLPAGSGYTRAEARLDVTRLTAGRYIVVATVLQNRLAVAQVRRSVDIRTAEMARP